MAKYFRPTRIVWLINALKVPKMNELLLTESIAEIVLLHEDFLPFIPPLFDQTIFHPSFLPLLNSSILALIRQHNNQRSEHDQ